MIQEFIVFGIVGLSIFFLVRHYWKLRRAKTGCASCKLMQSAQNKSSATIKK